MPEQIISASGVQHGLLVNADGTINVSGALSSASPGYTESEIIRLSMGSPATNFRLKALSDTLAIDNLGSSPIYFQFDGSATPSASGTGFLEARDSISLDLRAGSISIQGSGLTSPEVQIIALSLT